MPDSTDEKRLKRRWQNMKQRCYNPKNPNYVNYGGRDIRVCDRWRNSFDAFLEDMGYPPAGLSLDRIDNDGNYEPGNCRWATRLEQNNNQRISRIFRNNRVGHKHVSPKDGGYRVQIKFSFGQFDGGYYTNPKDAATAVVHLQEAVRLASAQAEQRGRIDELNRLQEASDTVNWLEDDYAVYLTARLEELKGTKHGR